MEAKARRSNLRCEGEDASDIGGKSDGGPKSYSETVALVLRRWAWCLGAMPVWRV